MSRSLRENFGRWWLRLSGDKSSRRKWSGHERREVSQQLELLENRLVMSNDALALAPQLLKETDPTAITGQSSDPSGYAVLNNRAIFAATNATNGRELWITDGTADGTRLLKDLQVGELGSAPQNIVTVGTTVFFTANDGLRGREVWKTDGTEAGTVLVADLKAGGGGTRFGELIDGNGTLFFSAGDALYRSNGTAAGTTLVKNGLAGLHDLTMFQGTLYFAANAGLMRSDGTSAGTILVSSLNSVDELTPTSTTLFFRAARNNTDVELFKSDGTDAGTVRVKDINPNASSQPNGLMAINDRLFFIANDGTRGLGLWTSTGTGATTTFVTSVGTTGAVLGEVNGKACFWAFGRRIGISDGTVLGTSYLQAIPGEELDAGARSAVKLGNRLVFVGQRRDPQGYVGAFEQALWITDGTEAGSTRLTGFTAGNLTNLPVVLGQQVLFSQSSASKGRELWGTDGTVAGTKLLRDIHSDTTLGSTFADRRTSDLSAPVVANGRLFFQSNDTSGRLQVWQTGGANSTTSPVTNLSGTLVFNSLVSSGNRIFFVEVVRDPVTQADTFNLWTSDGSGAPTLLRSFSRNASLVADQGIVYFVSGGELWKSDGTAAGTQKLLDNVNFSQMVVAGGQLFFREFLWPDRTRPFGERIGCLDGNSVLPLTPMLEGGQFSDLVAVGQRVLFVDSGSNVWGSDGTVAGTVSLNMKAEHLESFGSQAIFGFTAGNLPSLTGLFVTDGTTAGTRRVLAADLPFEQVRVANGSLFTANLQRVDLTSGQITTLATLPTGERVLSTFVSASGRFFFTTSNTAGIGAIWSSDGTPAGTTRLRSFQQLHQNVDPVSLLGAPFGQFGEINGRVFVQVRNAANGFEPWIIPTRPAVEITLPTTGVGEFSLVRDGANLLVKQGATTLQTLPLASLDTLTLIGSNRNETLTLDFAAGNPLPADLRFQAAGTTDSDKLIVKGGSIGDDLFSLLSPDSGELVLNANVVRFSGLSLVDDQLTAARRTIGFTSGRDNVALQDDSVANNNRSQLVRGATSLTFTHPSSALSINLGGGSDTLQVRGVDGSASRVLNVDAGDGDDTVTGGRLPMYVVGGGGKDSLSGGSANDTLLGNLGNDILLGGDGNDSLDGGNDDDTLIGGEGHDNLLGGLGNDGLIGNAGNDTLNGQAGNDTLLGSAGNDSLLGSSGDDLLLGGDDHDTINGGAGRDTVTAAGGDTPVTPNDLVQDLATEIDNHITVTAAWSTRQ